MAYRDHPGPFREKQQECIKIPETKTFSKKLGGEKFLFGK